MTDELKKKVDFAIKLLRSIPTEDGPVEISFSGGKDSEVILELAKMAGIPYRAIYKNTSIDPPGTIAHCKSKGVEVMAPTINFFDLVKKKGCPTRRARFCCEYLKEYKVLDRAVQGIRRSESVKRAKRYKEPEVCRSYPKGLKARIYLPILAHGISTVEGKRLSGTSELFKERIMKTRLTAEESAKLIELGVSPERASMCLLNLDYDSEVIPCEDVWEENGRFLANVNDEVIDVDRKIVTKDSDFDHSYANDNPIFTLTDIIDILPKEIRHNGCTYKLNIDYPPISMVAARYNTEEDDLDSLKGCLCEELIDALYSLLVWAINHNHVKLG